MGGFQIWTFILVSDSVDEIQPWTLLFSEFSIASLRRLKKPLEAEKTMGDEFKFGKFVTSPAFWSWVT